METRICDLSLINRFRKENQREAEEADVSSPDMARVIGYHAYAQYMDNKEYADRADKALEAALSSLSDETPLKLENGLLGVACGLTYLLDCGFVEGDADEILMDVDQLFLKAISRLPDDCPADWFDWLSYMRRRIAYKRERSNQFIEIIFRHYAACLFKRLEQEVQKGFIPDKRLSNEIEIFRHLQVTSPVKKKSILFCIDTLGHGGAERLLIDILKRLDSEQFDLTLHVLVNQGMYFDDIPESINWFTSSSMVGFEEFYHIQFDVEIAFLEGLAVKYIAQRNSNALKIAWIHIDLDQFNWCRRFYGTDEEERDCFSLMQKLVFVSNCCLDGFTERFPSVGGDKLVMHNFTDREEILKMSKEMSVPKTKFTICCVGRLCKAKGYELFLNVIRCLLLDGYDFQVWILGDGELRDLLAARIKELALTDHVLLKGFCKNPYPYMAEADLFVLTSLVEGAPLVLCEALSLGTPVLATRSKGTEEILGQGEYGMLVHINEDAIYEGMKQVLTDQAVYEELKQKAKKGIAHFDIKKAMCLITDFLQSL